MKLQREFPIAIIISVFWVTPAYAYLDLGTGSILLQTLAAGIATVITTLSFYWKKIRAFFSKSEKMPKDRK